MTRSLLATLLLVGAACSSPASPPASGSLRIVAQDSALQLENLSNEPVFYLVYERQAAALINWAPCVSQSGAPGTQLPEVLDHWRLRTGENGSYRVVVGAVPGPAD